MGLITHRNVDSILMLEFKDMVSRNSFSSRAAEELLMLCENEIAKHENGRLSGVVFTAPGRVFCSGGNLSDYAAVETAGPGQQLNGRIAELLNQFTKLPVPTVCVVQGDCFGGGLELISAFDIVLSAPSSLFGFWQRRVGLSFGWGGGARLVRRLGEARVRQLALKAATFGALEARRIGLIDGVCTEPLLIDEAISQIKKMQALPVRPVEAMKSNAISSERTVFESLWWGEEHLSELAKRRPASAK